MLLGLFLVSPLTKLSSYLLDCPCLGVLAVANAIKNMGALLVLSLNSNSLGPDGGKALAEGLRGNSVIEELNIAHNDLADYGTDMSGVVAIADVIPGMGALSSLNLSSNMLCGFYTNEYGQQKGTFDSAGNLLAN